MAIANTVAVLNAMQADGVIGRYAIAGAVAAYNYIEPTLTEDLDVLVAFNDPPQRKVTGLVTLEPIFSFLAGQGYARLEGEGVIIEGWRVQFLPAANALDEEALASADEIALAHGDVGTVRMRILRPEHLVANCLLVDRLKDQVRIMQFLTEDAVNTEALCGVLARHGKWGEYCAKMRIRNPCDRAHA
jgi:hypothetical protein